MFEFEVRLDPVQRPEFDHGESTSTDQLESIPALTKMLVLAHQIQREVDQVEATDYAEIARQLGVSRARVAQIVRLARLAPKIQEVILTDPDRVVTLRERMIRQIDVAADESAQWQHFIRLLNESRKPG